MARAKIIGVHLYARILIPWLHKILAIKFAMQSISASHAHQVVLFRLQLLVHAIDHQGRSGLKTVALAFCASYGHLHSNSRLFNN